MVVGTSVGAVAFLLGTGKNTSKKIIFNMELQKSDLSEICASLDDVYMPLFKHPLLEAFLYVKWKSIRWFYLLNLILYVFFLSDFWLGWSLHEYYLFKDLRNE